MAEVLPGVHQVEGVDPSPEFSTHVYLLKDAGATWTLLDSGLPGSDVAIEAYAKKHGIGLHQITKIVITHLHRDHVGGLRKMLDKTKAKSFAHWLDAAFIAQKPLYEGPGTPPAEPVEVDERIKDGDRIDAAGGLVAFHTPGHTPGHTCYYQPERKLLFSGDLFFGGPKGPMLTTPEYTQHMGSAKVSARRVAALDIVAVMTYHGGPYLTQGSERLRTLIAQL